MSAPTPQSVITWKEVTERRFWQMLEILPPAFQAEYGFLVGEPQTHRVCARTGQFDEACSAFCEIAGRFFEASDPMTCAEFKAVKVADVLASAQVQP